MAKIRVKKVVFEDIEIPDYYTWDESLRGQIVDALLDTNPDSRKYRRNYFYEDDGINVESLAREFREAYQKANLILDTINAAMTKNGYTGLPKDIGDLR